MLILDSYNRTALYYASNNGNSNFVKTLIRHRINDMSQIVLKHPDVIKVYQSVVNGKFKRKVVKSIVPRVKVENDQSKFRKDLSEIYDSKCIITGKALSECDHQYISSPKQYGKPGYTADNGILISKYINRAFYKKGKIKFDKTSILDFDADFVMIRVITDEMDILDINGKMVKIQRVSIPFII